jgi:type II secretory pathway component GspD/PulD (secretin)
MRDLLGRSDEKEVLSEVGVPPAAPTRGEVVVADANLREVVVVDADLEEVVVVVDANLGEVVVVDADLEEVVVVVDADLEDMVDDALAGLVGVFLVFVEFALVASDIVPTALPKLSRASAYFQ